MRTPHNLLRFNLFYHAGTGGLQVVSSAAGQDHADYNRIYRNSFYHNGHQETDPGFQGGIYFANWSGQSPVGNVVKGNIFYDNKSGAISYEGQVDPQVIENNWDQNSVDPEFVNLSAGDPDNPNLPDLRLQASSPCIDAGAYPTSITRAAGTTFAGCNGSAGLQPAFGLTAYLKTPRSGGPDSRRAAQTTVNIGATRLRRSVALPTSVFSTGC